ncbi:CvpA family protein [Candidatus Contubernalis alkaliaceticus]|uniref:CvpA family protein n=1 Tax=Candidatus Contubernalis alkaliaceticus TaxID=338645 RepID=UPI001F4C3562|nr:CvpA family protein [Candidatus Contubernalis alkalaceticus]UNC93718.1 CvpA family protein [Candidatus Contubernalis alkalaceticus]
MPVNWFDIAVLGFLTWGAVNGYFRGLTLSLINVLFWLFSMALAFYAKGPAAVFVNQQYGLNPLITQVLSKNMDLSLRVTTVPAVDDALPVFIQYMPVNPPVKVSMLEYFYREGEKFIYQGSGPAEFLYSWVAEVLVQILCFAAALTIIIALFKLVEGAWVLKKQEKLLAGTKSLTGLFMGFFKNLFVLSVIIFLVSPLLEVSDFFLMEDLSTSYVLKISNFFQYIFWRI